MIANVFVGVIESIEQLVVVIDQKGKSMRVKFTGRARLVVLTVIVVIVVVAIAWIHAVCFWIYAYYVM